MGPAQARPHPDADSRGIAIHIRVGIVDSECLYKEEVHADRFQVTQVWVSDHYRWQRTRCSTPASGNQSLATPHQDQQKEYMRSAATAPVARGALSGPIAGISFIGGIGAANALADHPYP